jgi:hypothetical protein
MRHRILQPATDLRCAMWITRVTSRLGRDELNRLRYVTEQQLMTGTERKSACTVRITVKLRPDEYDELFRHVCEIGSTMSAFFRESAARAMKEKHPDTALSHTPPRCEA